jgi:hypothetical protein
MRYAGDAIEFADRFRDLWDELAVWSQANRRNDGSEVMLKSTAH